MEDTQEITTQEPKALRDERGRMLAPLPGKHTITKADASILARKRWDKYRQQAVKRIVDEAKSIDPSVSVGADAFGLVAAKQYAALMDSEKPRIADLEKLGQIMTGMSADPQRANEAAPPNAISAAPAQIMELVDLIERHRAAAVDAARAVDAEATDTRNE